MKNFRHMARAATFAAGLSLAVFAGSGAEAQQKLSFTYNFGDKGAVADAMKWWTGELSKRTNGGVEVEIFWRNGLGVGFRNTLSAVQDGTADLGEVAAVFSAKNTPAWALADTGQGSSDPYVATRAFDNLRARFPRIDEELKTAGLQYMWHYSWGGVVLLGKGDEPITSPSQYTGQNVRVSSFLARAIKTNGWNANPVSGVGIGEMFQAFNRGTIDGGSNYMKDIISAQLNDVIDWVSILDQGQHMGLVVMNADIWQALAPQTRAVIDELRPEMIQRLTRGEIEENARIRSQLETQGLKVADVSPEEAAVWGAAMQASFVQRAETVKDVFPQSGEFVDALQEEIAKVAAQVDGDRYPWK
jgi:TRAP-type C4-dicarboxylate transport system substrate-binding protein